MYLYLTDSSTEIPGGNTQLADTSSSTSLAAKGQRQRQRQRHIWRARHTQKERLEFLTERKALFLVQINAMWNPQNLGWGGGRGGMLHGLTHLCTLASYSRNAWPLTITPIFSGRTRIHFFRGASVITLFPSCNQAGPCGALPEQELPPSPETLIKE